MTTVDAGMAMEIRSDRRFRFDARRPTVWAAIERVDRYLEWWSWLHHFDGTALRSGETWRCAVKSPLPYTLRFEVELVDVIEGECVVANVDGDIAGRAHLIATDRGSGSEVRLVSELVPSKATLRLVTMVARPLATFGHDWVLDNGAREFRTAVLG